MDNLPKVSLGGREFPVPEVAIENLRQVLPGLSKLAVLTSDPNFMAHLGTEEWGLLIDTVWAGIAGGSPGFTKQQFEKLTAKPTELATALQVIGMQSGMMKERRDGDAAVGEAVAASLPTGTRSSRKSSARPAGLGTM